MRSCNRNINVKRSCDIKRDIKIRRNRDSKSTSECTSNKCRCIAINLNMDMARAAHYNLSVLRVVLVIISELCSIARNMY